MKWTNRVGKWLGVGSVLTTIAAGGAGCLSRPVGTQPPTTKVNFTSTISQQQVDKVDVLFAIDNSASMGDKQEILADAVPNLLRGLLEPNCVDADGKQTGKLADPSLSKDQNYGCAEGTTAEFKPVTDMHIGIISSSLGGMGGDVCSDEGTSNDRAHLLNRTADGSAAATFLAWYPSNAENEDKKRHPDPPVPAVTDSAALNQAFQSLVVGVGQDGCGLEAQLESVYRFLIQPDPWTKVTVDDKGRANLGAATDIDLELLQQRADFLRPDSLVAVVMLTDEDDSSADPLSVGGQGWAFMSNKFPSSTVVRSDGKTTTAPRGTKACATSPGSPECTSCGFAATCDASQAACQKIKEDCKDNPYYGPDDDSLNVRFHRMKERFGIDPQYPIRRYVDGFTKQRVPDRASEHPRNSNGDIQPYAFTGKCTNPLFAQKLPRNAGEEYCNLPQSTRSSELVFFAVVGGVPNELLHFDPNDVTGETNEITSADWVKILGADPANYNYTGISPYMIQSISPRGQGIPGPSATHGDNGTDKTVGRDWDTKKNDLQYACTFDLPTDKVRECSTTNSNSCDCGKQELNPPLCDSGTTQIKAKAYPTIREFQVVRALGGQGIISSLCPIQLDPARSTAGDYGYNPAVKAIVDRLKNALNTQCLPQQLTREEAPGPDQNKVPCLVLAQLADVTDSCSRYEGLATPEPDILNKFLEQQRALSGDVKEGGVDLAALPVCTVPQIVVARGDTCAPDSQIGWCYVENDKPAGKNPAGRCPQALLFSDGAGSLAGARFSLQCIQQFSSSEDAGTAQ